MERYPTISPKDLENLAREGKKQGTHPENDIYQDQIADDGQEIIDAIRTEETEVEADLDSRPPPFETSLYFLR